MEMLVGGIAMVLAGVGALYLIALAREAWDGRQTKQPTAPKAEPECDHVWAPWSEPKDMGVKQKSTKYEHYSGSTTVESEFVGKFQERFCETCNQYERRWA